MPDYISIFAQQNQNYNDWNLWNHIKSKIYIFNKNYTWFRRLFPIENQIAADFENFKRV